MEIWVFLFLSFIPLSSFIREQEEYTERMLNLPGASLFPTSYQQTEVGQAKARRPELHLGLL